MPLTPAQIAQLNEAINGYNFPSVYFDFSNEIEIMAQNMTEVETVIAGQLRSQEGVITKYGLANILYWGYARIGYREKRVNKFINKVTEQQIIAFQSLIAANAIPVMTAIKRIGLPQYSGVSFISKILMFLNPTAYCVLDKQLTKLRTPESPKILNDLIFRQDETQIRITNHNEVVYNGWRNECSAISQMYFQGAHRVVDVERGFFTLIQNNNLLNARAIYNDA